MEPLPTGAPTGTRQLRNDPVQARSSARLTALLDAAAAVIEEVGREKLTTALVADRARASIGTVYRYFPDRIALLRELAGRNRERILEGLRSELSLDRHDSIAVAVDASYDVFVRGFRSEPGFRSLRAGDVIDAQPAPEVASNTQIAAELLDLLARRFAIEVSDETRFACESIIEVTDAFLSRAFARSATGEDAFIETGRTTVRQLALDGLGEAL